MKAKTTRRALLLSAMALLLCVSMLVGTTFAWFTDSVTSGVNIIAAGNLDVGLEYATVANGQVSGWNEVKKDVPLFNPDALWEPGHVEVVYLKVSNLGSLELKYQLNVDVDEANEIAGINVDGQEFKLSDHLVFKAVPMKDPFTTYTDRQAVAAAAGTELGLKDYNGKTTQLSPKGENANSEDYVALIVYMPETVGNEANYRGTSVPTIQLGVSLLATQVTEEEDSFGPDYDEDAWVNGFDVHSAQELQAAIDAGESAIDLMDDIAVEEQILIPAGASVTLNLNGKKLSSTSGTVIRNEGSLKLTGSGTVESTAQAYAIRVQQGNVVIDSADIAVKGAFGAVSIFNGANVIINGGNYMAEGINGKTSHTVYVSGSTLTVNGGTFDSGYSSEGIDTICGSNSTITLNGGTFYASELGSNFFLKNVTTVKGGTYQYKPANIAPGLSAEQNTDGMWVVGAAIKDTEDLQNAINNAADGETIVLAQNLKADDGILLTDKNVTIDLGGNVLSVTTGANTNSRNFLVKGNAKVTIKNGTLIAAGERTSGAYGTIRTEGNAQVTLENMKLYSYRAYGLNVKACTGTTVTINNSEIYAQYGGGVEAAGGTIVLNNTKIEQTGVDSASDWCSVAIGVNGGGKVIVNSGSYYAAPIATDSNATEGTWVAYVMSSGGTLEINGGTFNGIVTQNPGAANACGIICADTKAVVNINGGEFISNGAICDVRNNTGGTPNPKVTLAGGKYSADPRVSGLWASNLIYVAEGYKAVENTDGTWSVVFDGAMVSSAEELAAALASGENIVLTQNISYTGGIALADGVSINGNGHEITYTGTEYAYHLLKLGTGAEVKNVTLNNYRVRTEDATSGTVSLQNVVINMTDDMTGLDISKGSGVAKLTNVQCKNITDATHLNPATQVQVDYNPYGDVLLGGAWGIEATNCEFGSLHGWNTRNNSSVSLNNTTCTVLRMHYWPGRTLYINGVETAWSESGAIPVAHDVGGCWSVQPAFK